MACQGIPGGKRGGAREDRDIGGGGAFGRLDSVAPGGYLAAPLLDAMALMTRAATNG